LISIGIFLSAGTLFPFPPLCRCETVQGFSAIPVDGAMQRKINKINAKSDINTVNNQLITDNNL
jgi:hypothetical protein